MRNVFKTFARLLPDYLIAPNYVIRFLQPLQTLRWVYPFICAKLKMSLKTQENRYLLRKLNQMIADFDVNCKAIFILFRLKDLISQTIICTHMVLPSHFTGFYLGQGHGHRRVVRFYYKKLTFKRFNEDL